MKIIGRLKHTSIMTLLALLLGSFGAHAEGTHDPQAPVYCTPPDMIAGGAVYFQSISVFNTSSNNGSSGYADATFSKNHNLVPRTTSFNVQTWSVNPDPSTRTLYVRAWIDWDQNYAFDEDPIDLGSHSGSATGYLMKSITVPGDAPLGEVRIRVIVQSGSYASSPCDQGALATHGEVEDWYINVKPAPADNTPPTVVTQNLDVYLDANGQATLTAAQVDDGSSDNTLIDTMWLDQSSFGCNDLGQQTVTLTVKDTADNSAQETATITVRDTIKPTPTEATLAAIEAECSAFGGFTVGGGGTFIPIPTATDNCGGTIYAMTNDPLFYDTQGTYTITWTYDDGHGNMAQQTQQVIIDDQTDPVPDLANLPAIEAECSAMGGFGFGAGGTFIDIPTATDNCGGTLYATTNDPLFYDAQGTYTITWTYDDGHGNTAQQPQQVIVDDQTAPTPDLSVLPTLTASCELTISTPPTATDNCDGTITAITADPLTYDQQGAHVIDWVYEDSKGNITTQVQHVIIEDTQAPIPDAVSLPMLSSACGVEVTQIPTATDNCDGSITATTNDPLEYQEQGSFTIEWVFEDAQGNQTTQLQDVMILDEEAPEPSAKELPKLTSACSVVVTSIPKAHDNCDGIIEGTTEDPLIYKEQGEYTIVWRFDDSHGNYTTQEQFVVIEDNLAPVADADTLEPLSGSCAVVVPDNFRPTATDNCGDVIVGETTDPKVYEEQGTYQIVWQFEDAYGNTSQQIQEVIVKDLSAPVPEAPYLPTLKAACELTVPVPVAVDDCAGLIRAHTTDPMTYAEQGSFEITWIYEDLYGNQSQQVQRVEISDQVAPTFDGPADVITCTDAVGDLSLRRVRDNCTNTTISYQLSGATEAQGTEDASQEAFNLGETLVTYLVADQNGNERSYSFTVTREELQAEVAQEGETLTATQATQYQWIDCQSGLAIAQATQRSFAPTESGEYAVVVSSANCSDTSACVAFTTTEIAPANEVVGLRLYPNPTDGQITLTMSDLSQAATLIMVDATGREVLRRSDLQAPQVKIDLSDLSRGVYFARVQQGNQQSVIRVLRR